MSSTLTEHDATCSREPGSDQEGAGAFYQVHDTDREIEQEKLRVFKTAVDQSTDGIALANLCGDILYVNVAWAKMHGYSADQLVGRHLSVFYTPEQMEQEVVPFNERLIATGSAQQGKIGHCRKDGTTFPTHMTVTGLRDADGNLFGLLAIARDITEQHRRRERDRFHLNFRTLVAEISASFIDVSDRSSFDVAMDWALASLGNLFGVDRSYLFRFSEDLSTMDNTHEWCGSGISAQKERIQQFPSDGLPWWKAQILELHPVQIPTVTALPAEAVAEKDEFQAQGIQSLICLPICDSRRRLIGFLGFDAVRAPHIWPEEQVDMLQMLAKIIGSTMERLETARILAESEGRYRTLFDQSRDAMMTLGPPSWRFTAGNPSACALFGVRDETEFTALGPWDVSPETQPDGRSSADEAQEMIALAVREGSSFFEWAHQSLDGRLIPCTVLLSRMHVAGQVFVHATVRDITALKQAETQIQQMESERRHSQKMEAVGQLAAGVAHEINNPVGFIMSNLGTLQGYAAHLKTLLDIGRNLDPETAGLPPELKTQIENLDQGELTFIAEDLDNLLTESLDGCVRVRDIVQNLKSFARADDKGLAAADLQECIESTLKIVWNELKYRCEIVKQYGEVPQVTCRIGEINQVIMNLLVNAAHAIGEHGTITITTRREEQTAVLEIADTGCGIAPEHLSRVFDPFFTTKPVGKGTGLGLNICHKIIERHGGVITVASTPGEGTTFTVRLPLAEAEAVPSEEDIIG